MSPTGATAYASATAAPSSMTATCGSPPRTVATKSWECRRSSARGARSAPQSVEEEAFRVEPVDLRQQREREREPPADRGDDEAAARGRAGHALASRGAPVDLERTNHARQVGEEVDREQDAPRDECELV